MKSLFIFFILFFTFTLFAEERNEIEVFAEKYLEAFEKKISSDFFKLEIDVSDSEIILDKKHGTFKYKFEEYHIDEGKMIIEKNFSNLNFQLVSSSKNPTFSINYKIKFE